MATVEYVAVVVVVSLALAVGGAVVDARALPGAVAGQLRRAYCLVANGDCLGPGGPRPCVVAARSRDRLTEVELALVRLRDGRTVVREQLSDGTVRVSVVAGNGASLAVHVGVRLGGRGIDAELAAGGDLGAVRTFVVTGDRAADRLVERLADEALPVGEGVRDATDFLLDRGRGDGDEVARTVEIRTRGAAAAEVAMIGPELAAVGQLVEGVRVERRTGRRTLLLRLSREVGAQLAEVVDGEGAGEVVAELALDARRRPEALTVRVRGEGAGRLVETDARLDLADPAARAALGRLAGGDLGAVRDLGERLASGARLDVRRYATTRDRSEDGGSLFGVGGTKVVVERTARLVSAQGREPGGSWGPNLDCAANA